MPFDAEITQRERDLILLEKAREKAATQWGPVRQNRLCIIECIWAVAPHMKAEDAACLLGFENQTEAFRWNDAERRRLREAVARFDEAIARLQAQ